MPERSIYSASDEPSPRMPERGSLRTLGEGQSQFIGSSTGVYFVNTVRRAFADADVRLSSASAWASNSGTDKDKNKSQPSPDAQPSPEDCIIADDEEGRGRRQPGDGSSASSRAPSALPASTLSYGPGIPIALGRPPPREVATKLFMIYFQSWHRFFPFLHGPTISKDLESLYETTNSEEETTTTRSTGYHRETSTGTKALPLARVIVLQCLFNLASFHGGAHLPAACRIDRPARVLSYLVGLAAKGDVISIQALFAAQLLLVARMSLRTAVVVAGLLSRVVFLAGLHRCPVRYGELSADDCDIRKRLFWCIYVLDRFLSQALGHPLGIQDSDVDVCSLRGPELHQGHVPTPPHDAPNSATAAASSAENPYPVEPGSRQKQERNQILAFQVEYSRLSGRALELFHKSIHIRSIDPTTVLSLRTDLDAWWNSLPPELQDLDTTEEASHGQTFSAPALFNLLHGQLRLLINRPWLSLEPSAAEFRSALQICISVSRDTILSMRQQQNAGYGLFWPGYLSAAWMSGVILAFACHLQLYPVEKGQREISLCLEILSGVTNRWPLARNCHIVLSEMLQTVQQKQYLSGKSPSAGSNKSVPSFGTPQFLDGKQKPDRASNQVRFSKRRRTNLEDQGTYAPISIPGNGQHHLAENAIPTDGQAEQRTHPGEFTNAIQEGQAMNGDIPGGTNPCGYDQSVDDDATFDPYASHQRMFMRAPPVDMTNNGINAGDITGGFPRPNLDAQWTDLPGISSWDGGMPDILHGATWESLLQVVNQNNVSWDDNFF